MKSSVQLKLEFNAVKDSFSKLCTYVRHLTNGLRRSFKCNKDIQRFLVLT